VLILFVKSLSVNLSYQRSYSVDPLASREYSFDDIVCVISRSIKLNYFSSGLVYTVRTTGFFSLYNGLGVTLVGSVPKAGIRFGGNAYCKKLLADENGKLTMAKQFLAGMVTHFQYIGHSFCTALTALHIIRAQEQSKRLWRLHQWKQSKRS
jgi:hypothetical protein